MKRSDKLLLSFFLSILCLYGLIHLALYNRWRQGKVIADLKTDEGWVTRYKGKAPALVFLQGNVNVRLLPSDTFFVEYPKDEGGKIHWGPEGADSLVIQGALTAMNPHDIFQRYGDYPWVDVHAGPHTRIRLNGLLALVKGLKNGGSAEWDIAADNTQLWIGETYGNETNNIAFEHFDSIRVQGRDVNLILHRNVIIGKLDVHLDDRSALKDQNATISQLGIHYTDQSRINLTGANLDKLREMP